MLTCKLAFPGYLTRGKAYDPVDYLPSLTGEFFLVRADDGELRAFHRTRFGGLPPPYIPAWRYFKLISEEVNGKAD